jgi:hypothetical protein
MNAQELTLARAASQLTPGDLNYLNENGLLSKEPTDSRATVTQEAGDKAEGAPPPGRKKRKRSKTSHEWPAVGAVLTADYEGQHYAAEVVEAPWYKGGKAVKILSGPSTGKTCKSMSQAMLEATTKQREEHGLAKKGVANGWQFWKPTSP